MLVVNGEASSSMSFSLTGDVSESAFVLLRRLFAPKQNSTKQQLIWRAFHATIQDNDDKVFSKVSERASR